MSAAPISFTTAEISAALGLSKRTVLYALADVPPTSMQPRQGGNAAAWSLAALPASLHARLETEAKRRCCLNAEALLRCPVKEWQPSVPLAEVSEETRARAVKLQRALSRALDRANDLGITAGELEQIGLEDYRRQFGFAISQRHWRRLFKRTCERDGGLENWSRLEIYLEEITRREKPTVQALANAQQWREISELISSFRNPIAPSETELALFWTFVFEQYEQAQARLKKLPAKRSLLAFLFRHAPFVSGSLAGVRKQFDRKLKRWQADGTPSALADKRHDNAGRFAPALTTEDRDKLVGQAVLFFGGNASRAWQKLSLAGELSETILMHYAAHRGTTDIPRAILAAVKPEIDRLDSIHHGPRQFKLNGPHLNRDWSKVHAGDWYQSDDCTLPVYFYIPDGQGWFTLTRGQFLPMIDLRSLRILEFALLPTKTYNSLAIRTLITRTCDTHGLPRRGFYFENGIWRSSKLITGAKDELPLAETEGGLRDLGLEFRHAQLPRGKPVERVLGLLQDMMEGERGYVGRDERNDCYERVQRQKLMVAAQREHPGKFFYSFAEWQLRLREICEEYNARQQRGKMTGSRSPDDAYEQLRNEGDPPVRFDANSRYLLAHHRRPVIVGRRGIVIRVGKQQFTYCNERTGQLEGEQVLAWFNPEVPEVLSVTDMNRQNAFAVPRLNDIDAMDATSEEIAAEKGKIAAHLAHAKAYYCTLKTKFGLKFRQNIVAPETAQLGREFNEQIAQAETEVRETRSRVARTQRAARALNLTPSQTAQLRPGSAEALEGLPDVLEELKADAAPAPVATVATVGSGPKVYALKSAPLSANIPQLRSAYWKLAKQVEALGVSRHALTQKHLGGHPKVNDMTAGQLSKMNQVFSSILRDAKTKGET